MRWWKGFMKLSKKNNGTTWSWVGKIGRVILCMHFLFSFISSPCLSSTTCYQLFFFSFLPSCAAQQHAINCFFWLRCKIKLFAFYFLSFFPVCAAQQHPLACYFFDWDAKSKFQLRLLSHMKILIYVIFFWKWKKTWFNLDSIKNETGEKMKKQNNVIKKYIDMRWGTMNLHHFQFPIYHPFPYAPKGGQSSCFAVGSALLNLSDWIGFAQKPKTLLVVCGMVQCDWKKNIGCYCRCDL